MDKIYKYVGGRKIFWGFVNLTVLTVCSFYVEPDNFRTLENGSFMLYSAMVLGNVLTKAVYGKFTSNLETKNNEVN